MAAHDRVFRPHAAIDGQRSSFRSDRTAPKAVERDLLQRDRWPCCKHCKAGPGLYLLCGRGRRKGTAEISRRRECALLWCNLARASGKSHTDPPADEATLAATRSKDRTFASRRTPAASFDAQRYCDSTRGLADYGRQEREAPLLESLRCPAFPTMRQPLSGHKVLRNIIKCHLAGTPRPVPQMKREPRMGRVSLFIWCQGRESNARHRTFQARALPTELPWRTDFSSAPRVPISFVNRGALVTLATLMGLEPTTFAVTGRRSNQLSYSAKTRTPTPEMVGTVGIEPTTPRV